MEFVVGEVRKPDSERPAIGAAETTWLSTLVAGRTVAMMSQGTPATPEAVEAPQEALDQHNGGYLLEQGLEKDFMHLAEAVGNVVLDLVIPAEVPPTLWTSDPQTTDVTELVYS